jgi:hypothetical protein
MSSAWHSLRSPFHAPPYPWRSRLPHARRLRRFNYWSDGRLEVPLVTLFNAEDPIIPIWQRDLYQAKVEAAGAEGGLTQLTSSVAFGHCTFAAGEAESAFALLASQVTGAAVAAR